MPWGPVWRKVLWRVCCWLLLAGSMHLEANASGRGGHVTALLLRLSVTGASAKADECRVVELQRDVALRCVVLYYLFVGIFCGEVFRQALYVCETHADAENVIAVNWCGITRAAQHAVRGNRD